MGAGVAGSGPMVGAEIFASVAASLEWTEKARAQAAEAKAAGIDLQVACPREERVVDFRLRAVLVVPLATMPQKDWPAFKIDMGSLALMDAAGNFSPARVKLVDLEKRALAEATLKHPELALLVTRALAAAE